MASSDSSDKERQSERLSELGKVLENALAKQGTSARSIAQRAGIGASHLSKVLKAKRTLRQAKLMILCDLLGLDRDRILRLAGFGPPEKSKLDLGGVTLLRTIDRFTLNVVVTPRFYDAALFMWIFQQQPLSEIGVQAQLRRAEWNTVPAELASYTYAIGFHSQAPSLFRVEKWSYLCLDKGHALIGRGRGRGPGRGKEALTQWMDQAKLKGNRLVMIAIDQGMVELFRSEVTLDEKVDVHIIPNPDVALESFREGAGELFLCGLPQRLALRNGEFTELVVHGPDFPWLSSLRALICSEKMMTEKRPLMHAIDALWYATCRRLYAEVEFRGQVFDEIIEMLERHGIERHNLVKEDFVNLFGTGGEEFEIFAQTPAQLMGK